MKRRSGARLGAVCTARMSPAVVTRLRTVGAHPPAWLRGWGALATRMWSAHGCRRPPHANHMGLPRVYRAGSPRAGCVGLPQACRAGSPRERPRRFTPRMQCGHGPCRPRGCDLRMACGWPARACRASNALAARVASRALAAQGVVSYACRASAMRARCHSGVTVSCSDLQLVPNYAAASRSASRCRWGQIIHFR